MCGGRRLTKLTNAKPARILEVEKAAMARKVINLYEAKTHLSRLVDEAAAGIEVVIAKAGKPLVRLVPVRDEKESCFGMDAGKGWIADDFDELPEDILKPENRITVRIADTMDADIPRRKISVMDGSIESELIYFFERPLRCGIFVRTGNEATGGGKIGETHSVLKV